MCCGNAASHGSETHPKSRDAPLVRLYQTAISTGHSLCAFFPTTGYSSTWSGMALGGLKYNGRLNLALLLMGLVEHKKRSLWGERCPQGHRLPLCLQSRARACVHFQW